jgi:hypothetical protein
MVSKRLQKELIGDYILTKRFTLDYEAIDTTIEYFLKTSREPEYARIMYIFTEEIREHLKNRNLLLPFIEVHNESK